MARLPFPPGERLLAVLIVCGALGLTAGCGQGDSERLLPVEGRVTLAGRPLRFGTVSFRPDASRGNGSLQHPSGEINDQGEYRLRTVGRPGAPPGWYKVLVFADANSQPGTEPQPVLPKWLVNVKYTAEQTTDLAVEVVETPPAQAYDLRLSR